MCTKANLFEKLFDWWYCLHKPCRDAHHRLFVIFRDACYFHCFCTYLFWQCEKLHMTLRIKSYIKTEKKLENKTIFLSVTFNKATSWPKVGTPRTHTLTYMRSSINEMQCKWGEKVLKAKKSFLHASILPEAKNSLIYSLCLLLPRAAVFH